MKPHAFEADADGDCVHCPLPAANKRAHPDPDQPAPVPPGLDRGKSPVPIVRNADPSTAHVAAARFQPKRDSAKGRVLAYLQARLGEWVDAPELTAREVGGFAGTRRMRELREVGWPIETRPHPDGSNVWQHRLLPERTPE